MLIAALATGACHAPEQSRAALIGAYVTSADVLCITVRLTDDEKVVVFPDATTDRLTGSPGTVAQMTLSQLRKLNSGATFTQADGTSHKYTAHPQSLGLLLDGLPDVPLLIDLAVADVELAKQAATQLANRQRASAALAKSNDAAALAAFAADAPGAGLIFEASAGQSPSETIAAATAAKASGIWAPAGELIDSALGEAIDQARNAGTLPMGAIAEQSGPFDAAVADALAKLPWVWAIAVECPLVATAHLSPGWRWIDEKWDVHAEDHADVDSHIWHLGYAKYNPERYCHVFADGGIVVDIKPFTGDVTYQPTGDPIQDKLEAVLERTWESNKDWPFYSGGGAGFVPGISGDFSAEVDIQSQRACQATTVEMAAINVDPATHRPPWIQVNGDWQPNYPTSFRDKHTFFDPHGAPPFVGVEHDEDDGWRINWNTGTDYDANQYGSPSGDGTLLTGRMRLDRRGAYFAAFYRDSGKETDADWVCVGVAENESLNDRVYLRLAGKRWRQEDPANPSQWMPVVPNRFQFTNMTITRFNRPRS